MRHTLLVLLAFLAVGPFVRTAGAQSRVQLAIVCDVSESMKGFTEQARTKLKQFVIDRVPPNRQSSLVVALYVYGLADQNEDSRIVQLSDFTNKTDELLAQLDRAVTDAGLTGGHEAPGKVLQAVENGLAWKPDPEATERLIVIAGNESFQQGDPSGLVIASRLPAHTELDGVTGLEVPAPISLHTIFCGPLPEGKRDNWEKAAEVGRGTFDAVDIRTLR